jgi:hypothetical protein
MVGSLRSVTLAIRRVAGFLGAFVAQPWQQSASLNFKKKGAINSQQKKFSGVLVAR